jgi:large subunit ribosomal protein L21
MSYAIISIGGKQYRVREGERLLVDRLSTDEGKTFSPSILMIGGDGEPDFDAKGTVTAKVVQHVRGDKIRIGKYRPKSGYRRHTGFRSSLSQIEIESIGAKRAARKTAEKPVAEAKPKPKAAAKPKAEIAAKPPKGYEELTVAQIGEAVGKWKAPAIEAALAYERAHGKRKGAIATLEAALEEKS